MPFEVEYFLKETPYYHTEADSPPYFVNDISSLFETTLLEGQEDHVVSLGPVTDDEGDEILIQFDNNGNQFIQMI